MKTIFSNSKKWMPLRYLCLIYLSLCGLGLVLSRFNDNESLFNIIFIGSLLMLPICSLGFLVYCIKVAIQTKLKTSRSKILIGIIVSVVLITVIWVFLDISSFDFDCHENDHSEYFDEYFFASLWGVYFFVFHLVLLLYLLSFNIYSLCTKFSQKGSKVFFYISIACIVMLLIIGCIMYLNKPDDNHPLDELEYPEEVIEQSLSVEDEFEQMIEALEFLGESQDTIDVIPDFEPSETIIDTDE